MTNISLGNALFYRYVGFDRDRFTEVARFAQGRLDQLQHRTASTTPQKHTIDRQLQPNTALPLGNTLTVPRHVRFPQFLTAHLFSPGYQQFSFAQSRGADATIDTYA